MDRKLSVVIPALNAAAFLPGTLAALGAGPQVIIVDGGSTDGTVGDVVAPRGRGSQIAAGVAAASYDWLLILHADTRLGADWRQAVAAHTDPMKAGYFRFVLDSRDPRARRLERLVAWRSRVLGLPYGDQGVLVHRRLLELVGGVRPIPLMEDVDLVRRIGRRRLVALDADAVTSASKYDNGGYLRRSARNLCCLTLWFCGVPPRWIVRLYA